MLNVIIAKPTKACNARCTYCAAAATTENNAKNKWSIDDFKLYFDKLVDYIHPEQYCLWLWHGGEPMLLGPDFYEEAHDYAKSKRPNLTMSMQSNILDYSTEKWLPTINRCFKGYVSTSFDPDMTGRVYKGSVENYTKRFFDKLQTLLDDGLNTFIIGCYTNEMVKKDLHMRMYELAQGYGEQAFGLRFNFRYPAGRAKGEGDFISPEVYGKMLVDLYDRWIAEGPRFSIVPITQILEKVVCGGSRCPWTRHCGGAIIGLEPDGSIWNCASFADIEDKRFMFGNLKTQDFKEIMSSPAARQIRRRVAILPDDCLKCKNLDVCEGGCARDSILFGGKIYEKTKYCQSWMMLIDRIKKSVQSGEATYMIKRYGFDKRMKRNLNIPIVAGIREEGKPMNAPSTSCGGEYNVEMSDEEKHKLKIAETASCAL